MFEHKGFKEAKTGRAIIEDVLPETIEALIKFAHTDQVEEKDLTAELLAAADKYQIKILFDRCESVLIKNLSCGNAAELYLMGYFHQANKLKESAKKFIFNFYLHIKKTEGMLIMAEHHPKALFELLDFFYKF